MELQFSANQQYQLDAIKSVVDLFDGQPQAADLGGLAQDSEIASIDLSYKGVANRLALASERLLQNCRKVQAANSVAQSDTLLPLTLDGGQAFGFPNFTVEMETGTG